MELGPESRMDVGESPIPVEFLNGSLRHICSVVRRCHAEESLHAVDPGDFSGLLRADGEVVDNRVTASFLSSSS
jgi:hypothetical protein